MTNSNNNIFSLNNSICLNSSVGILIIDQSYIKIFNFSVENFQNTNNNVFEFLDKNMIQI
jgi:hypothetical protein